MWTWYSDAFGADLPNENPAAGGTFKYNLRFPGQLYDSHAGLSQNYFRDYDPAIGRYVESDPILQVNRFAIPGETAFVVPSLIHYPTWLHPYNYVTNSPLREIDPLGLSPLNLIKCLYYGRRVVDAGKACKNECPESNDTEGIIGFIEKYAANGSLDTAMLNCTCKKVGPELCAKWLANCFATPIMGGPKP
jgi:RHS repeat-associated protein